MLDTIIIGGGIVGTAAAYNLARRGAQALLIDAHHTGRATDAGAGILSFGTHGIGQDDFWLDFSRKAGDYYAQLIEGLKTEQGGATGYAATGQLIVAATEDELAAFEHKRRLIAERHLRAGWPSAESISEIEPDEARKLFPPLADVYRALLYRDGARVDGRLLNAAMRRTAKSQGLMVREDTVERLVIENGAVTGVIASGETIAAGRVIIAGGAWSQTFGDQLGVQIPVSPKRGQIIHLSLPGTDTSAWPVVSAFHGHYLVAWHDSRVAAGATREANAGFNPHTTVAGVREVLGEALRVAPGLADAHIKEIRVGLRPATQDDLPVLGPVPGADGVYLATGHGAVGLQLGPYSGKLAAGWALGDSAETDIAAFSISRFHS